MTAEKMHSRPDLASNVFDMGRSLFSLILMFALCCTALTYSAQAQDKPQTQLSFTADIYPILREKCAKCHAKKTRGGLSVNTREAVLKGGKFGKVVLPGESENSLLYKMVIRQKEVKPMPRKRDPLNDQELKLIKKWIDQGAK